MLLFAVIAGSYQWLSVQTNSAPVAAAAISNDTYALVQTKSPEARFVVFNRPFVDITAIDPNAAIKFEVLPDVPSAVIRYASFAGRTDRGIVTVATGETIVWYTVAKK